MSNQSFDSLSKQLYNHLLNESFGRVEISVEVPGESLFIDVIFTPSPNPTGDCSSLGLLGRTIQRPCIFETYRNAPNLAATNICLLKRTWFAEELRRRASRAKQAKAVEDSPQLWIVTPTASDRYLEAFAAKTKEGWPPGVYWLPRGNYSAIIVIHHLPVEPDTLWFRLLGKGGTQTKAVKEVLALPQGDSQRNDALKLLSTWKIVEGIYPDLEQTDREFTMALSQAYLEWEKEVQQRGIALGEQRGIALGEQRGIALGEQRGIALGEQRGIALGEQRGKQEIALNMLRSGMNIEQIAQLTGLDLQQIQDLSL